MFQVGSLKFVSVSPDSGVICCAWKWPVQVLCEYVLTVCGFAECSCLNLGKWPSGFVLSPMTEDYLKDFNMLLCVILRLVMWNGMLLCVHGTRRAIHASVYGFGVTRALAHLGY